jgi:hypothetical protein
MGKECKSILLKPEYVTGDRTMLILIGMIIIVAGILVYMIFNGDIIGGTKDIVMKFMESV